ncbi:MAG: thiol reductant ABC exporter subunit CydD [Gammaproteobacteria bacterium]|nr:MAG: thiol reductant ABC exporter subunit CydD [Gammaproteobacteria bacterium]UTW43735.1 thiol reductant ABC exporter subunit CydD [bacterium SCSIO 12844]
MKTKDKQQTKDAARWLKNKTIPLKKNILLVSLIGTLSGILLILIAYCIAHIADSAYLKHQTTEALWFYFIGIISLFILRAGLIWLKERISFKTSEKIRTNLREEVLEKIKQMGPVHAKSFSSGNLVSNAIEQVEALNNYLVYYLPQMSIAVFLPIVILVFIFPISLTSGFILLICAPLIPLFMALIGIGAESVHQKHFQNLAKMSNHFLDVLNGLTTLKLFGKSKSEEKNIYHTSDQYRITTMQVLRVAFLSSAVLEVFAAVSIAIVAVYLGMGFLNEGTSNPIWWSISNISLTGALFILLLAPEFFLPLRELSTHYHARAEAVGAATELKKLFDYDLHKSNQPINDSVKTNTFNLAEDTITFKQVDLSYSESSTPALNHINVEIKPKQKIILLGPSGAGKSSFLNLLLRFLVPSNGEICINQTNLNAMNPNNWYQQISWLGQIPKLFSGTLYDNLLMAKPDATESEINQVLEDVQLKTLVNQLPNGLNTIIGENSIGLSGGQAQRFALARTLLKDAPLVILDEPTQSLDYEHEHLIMDMLKSRLKNKTIIMATHRLEHLEAVDQILILNEGKIIQSGDYKTLSSKPSSYLQTLLKNIQGEVSYA